MTPMIFLLLAVPLGVVFIAVAILSDLKGYRDAVCSCEKAYWRWRGMAHLLFAYGVILLGLLAVDNFRDEPWNLSMWWPSLTRDLWEVKNRAVVILLDVLVVLMAALGTMGIARYFGYVDENEVWHASNRLVCNLTAIRVRGVVGGIRHPCRIAVQGKCTSSAKPQEP